jgi:multiple antibiotic resistance protein
MDFKPLLTLLAVVNPLAIVPFFIHYTQDFSREQRLRTIWISSVSAFAVIAISALLGLQILAFFGITLASFQVGGGLLLMTSALSMLNAQPAKARDLLQLGALVAYGVVIAIATALCFSLAQPIARVLGKTGINVMTRLMGLILAALAVEVMSDGLVKLFPALGR